MRKLLITGVSGFIGRYAAQHFSRLGWSVVGIGRGAKENAPVASLEQYYQLELPHKHLINVLKADTFSACIHCAGRASVTGSVEHPADDFVANTALTFFVLDSLRQVQPECKLVLLSSAAVYGNPRTLPIDESSLTSPLSPYGFHKWQSELLCMEFARIYNLPTTSLRIFSAYGPGLRRQVMWDISQKLLSGRAFVLQGTGQESRDFIHGIDIARALECVIRYAPMEGEVYNLAVGKEVRIHELARLLQQALDPDKQQSIVFDQHLPEGVPSNWHADIQRICALGFKPSVTFEQGVATVARWCRAEFLGLD